MAVIEIYTDGSYQPSVNPDVSGWGFVVAGKNVTGSGVVEKPVSRNIDGELMAVKEALLWIQKQSGNQKYAIVYDYQGVGAWAKNEWKANTPLTQGYKDFVSNILMEFALRGIKVSFIWVKGHSGNHYNDIADDLATGAVRKFSNEGIVKTTPSDLEEVSENEKISEILERIANVSKELQSIGDFLVENFK